MVEIPHELLEQFERGNVLLFIGEQLVTDPSGRQIFDGLTEDIISRARIEDGDSLTFFEAAQLYEYEMGRQALVQLVRDRVEGLGEEPQPVHHLIASLQECSVFVTTAIDTRLEAAFQMAGRPLDIFVATTDIPFDNSQRADLFKLRGALRQPDTLVLTEEDFERFLDTQHTISVILQGYLARQTILFVGYDLNDPYFRRLYRKVVLSLDGLSRRAYAFGTALPRRTSRWCERNNIQVVEFGAAGFLQELATQLKGARHGSRTQGAADLSSLVVPGIPAQPYKLLDYYDADDAAIFFGRSDEIRRVAALVHAHRLVVLYGASGAGKTSLLLAGVAPLLTQGDPSYHALYIRAVGEPLDTTRKAICRLLPEEGPDSKAGLYTLVAKATKVLGVPILLIFDQFEEFFIRFNPQLREPFIQEIGSLYDAQDLAVKIVFSLREDWLASLGEFEHRIPGVYRNRLRLLPLNREQAYQAIVRPVALLGVTYEQRLIDTLLEALLGGDNEEGKSVMPPQLQLVCSALYNRLRPGQSTITLDDYSAVGGVRGILQRYLEDELAYLPRDDQAIAHAALEELVTSHGTKSVKSLSELATGTGVDEARLAAVVQRLINARLLRVVERESRDSAYELAHEYLIREIDLSGEVKLRKEAEELIKQELGNWEHFGTVISPEKLALINEVREVLRLDELSQELMLRSALQSGFEVDYWLTRVENTSRQTDILLEAAHSRAPVVRERAARALGSQSSLPAVQGLVILAMDDTEANIRNAARQSLKRLPSDAQHRATDLVAAELGSDVDGKRQRVLEALTVLPLETLPPSVRSQVLMTKSRMAVVDAGSRAVSTPTRRAALLTMALLGTVVICVYLLAFNSYTISSEYDAGADKTYVTVKRGLPWLQLGRVANSGFGSSQVAKDRREAVAQGQMWGLLAAVDSDGYKAWGRQIVQALDVQDRLPSEWYLTRDDSIYTQLLDESHWTPENTEWYLAALGQVGAYNAEFADQAVTKLSTVLINPSYSDEQLAMAAMALHQVINVRPALFDPMVTEQVITAAKQYILDRNDERYPLTAVYLLPLLAHIDLEHTVSEGLNYRQVTEPAFKNLQVANTSMSYAVLGALSAEDLTSASLAGRLLEDMIVAALNDRTEQSVRISLMYAAGELLYGYAGGANRMVDTKYLSQYVGKLYAILTSEQETIKLRTNVAYALAGLLPEVAATPQQMLDTLLDIVDSPEYSQIDDFQVCQIVGQILKSNGYVDPTRSLEELQQIAFNHELRDPIREVAVCELDTIFRESPALLTPGHVDATWNHLVKAQYTPDAEYSTLWMFAAMVSDNPQHVTLQQAETAIALLESSNTGVRRAASAMLIGGAIHEYPDIASPALYDKLASLLEDDRLPSFFRSNAADSLVAVALANSQLKASVRTLLQKYAAHDVVNTVYFYDEADISRIARDSLTNLYVKDKDVSDDELLLLLGNPTEPQIRAVAANALIERALDDRQLTSYLQERLSSLAVSEDPIARMWASRLLPSVSLVELVHDTSKDPVRSSETRTLLDNVTGLLSVSTLSTDSKLMQFYDVVFTAAALSASAWMYNNDEQPDK
ncbi:MAG: SIR2 family protein [Caldilineaceae bacterium]